MPALYLHTRRDDSPSDTSGLNPIYIAGFCLAGCLVFGLAIWLLVRFRRRRSAAKREEARGAAFLSVRGVVSENGEKGQNAQPRHAGFSRGQLNSTIILPDKVLTRPPRTPQDVIQHHRDSGTFPSPFSAKPFSFALSAVPPSSPTSANRSSFLSFGSASSRPSRFSVFSLNSTHSSLDTIPTTGTLRKIRQIFEPVLPDEIVCRLGDQLTVVQSFDDGWCLVGRENSAFAAAAKSLFKKGDAQNDVELGVVPAWCFLKPVPGLRTERPVRSSSLGITVQMTAPGSDRDDVRSWSNF